MLTNQDDAAGPGDNIEIRDGQEGRGRMAEIDATGKDDPTGEAKNAEENYVPEENRLGSEDTKEVESANNPAAEKPNHAPVPIASPPAGGQQPPSTAKPFNAEIAKPLPEKAARAAVSKDALQEVKVEPPAQMKTSAAVKPAPPAAPSIQTPPKPDVREALPDPEPESAKVQPMVIDAKAAAIGPDDTLPSREATSKIAERKIAPAKTAVKVQNRNGDITSSSDTLGPSPESRGKNTDDKSYQTEKPAGIASAKKGGQAANGNSVAGGAASGNGALSEKGSSRGPTKSGGPRGAGGYGDGGALNTADTRAGSGKGYKFSGGAHSREFGLLRGKGDAFGKQILAGRERASGEGTPQKKENKTTAESAPPVAIHIPEELLERDISIEVATDEKALSDISMALARRAHPTNRRKNAADAERKIEEAEITAGKRGSGTPATKILTVRKAEKGVYIFSLANAGDAYLVTVVFRLYARTTRERTKEYKSLSLTPATAAKFKFLMPEAVFWDDTDSFSGSMEDSHSVTKFRYDTDLLWKEEKER